jgi:prevent-host-death family protein
MDTIAVSELRANLMSILNEIEHGSTKTITSRGKVIAKLVPPDYSQEKAKSRLMEIGETAVIGDLISPIDAQWEASE